MMLSTACVSASHPALPDAPGKQLARLGDAHQIHEHRLRTLGDNEARQLVAAGHDDQAARRAG